MKRKNKKPLTEDELIMWLFFIVTVGGLFSRVVQLID